MDELLNNGGVVDDAKVPPTNEAVWQEDKQIGDKLQSTTPRRTISLET